MDMKPLTVLNCRKGSSVDTIEISRFLENTTKTFKDFTLIDVRVLLAVASNEGIVMKDLSSIMEVPQATLSRTIKKLTGGVTFFEMSIGSFSLNVELSDEKHGLIEQKIHPTELKKRTLYLTTLGKQTLNNLLESKNAT